MSKISLVPFFTVLSLGFTLTWGPAVSLLGAGTLTTSVSADTSRETGAAKTREPSLETRRTMGCPATLTCA